MLQIFEIVFAQPDLNEPYGRLRNLVKPVYWLSRTGSCAIISGLIVFTLCLFVSNLHADVIYQIDDGSSEFTVGIDPGEDLNWFNTFPVESGGEVIDTISAAFGRPGLGQSLNGLSISVLLYEDPNGGSPADAKLVEQIFDIVKNANTNTFETFSIPDSIVEGNLVTGLLFRNTTNETKFIAAVDQSSPTTPNRSYLGFSVGLDETDLGSIPETQFGSLASFNIDGNFLIRGIGHAIPEPTISFLLLLGIFAIRTRPNR